jgi:hypothetical protein
MKENKKASHRKGRPVFENPTIHQNFYTRLLALNFLTTIMFFDEPGIKIVMPHVLQNSTDAVNGKSVLNHRVYIREATNFGLTISKTIRKKHNFFVRTAAPENEYGLIKKIAAMKMLFSDL